jgi:hypothetical protein
MTSRALMMQPVELRPYPPPYGEWRPRKGAWDQLQASRAYHDTLHERADPAERPVALDVEV